MAATHHTDFEALVEALPETAEALTLAVEILSSSGEHLQAEAILRNALTRTPLASLRTTLARVLMEQERFKEAMTETVNVLRTESENAEALLLLAQSLIECGELERGGKMLQKARFAGSDPTETASAEDRYRELLADADNATFADSTLPEIHVEQLAAPAAPTKPAKPTKPAPPPLRDGPKSKKRHETLLGHPALAPQSSPSLDKPKLPTPPPLPAVPPPFASGGFAKLDTWDIATDDGELETTVTPPEKVRLRDGAVERLPAATTPRPIPRVPPASELATPSEATTSLVLTDDDFATPDEHTSHIHVSDDEITRARDSLIQHVDDMPSVEYDAGFAAEAHQAHAPPADLDALPSWDAALDAERGSAPGWDHDAAEASHFPVGEGWNEDFSAPGPYDRRHLDESGPTQDGAWEQQPAPAPSASPHISQNNFVYEAAPQRAPDPQVTAVNPTPTPHSYEVAKPRKAKARWPLAILGVFAVTLVAFAALAFAAGNSVSGTIEGKIATSVEARAPDTYTGYVAAANALRDVDDVHSFMGAGFDRLTTTAVPLGASSTALRQTAAAELALVTAQLEYRFERAGERQAQQHLATAKRVAPSHPATLLAEAYLELSANRPATAIALLEAQTKVDDVRVAETLAWANLAIGRPNAARRAAESLGAQPSVSQQFLLASIAAAMGDKDAPAAFAGVFATSTDHVDARIERAYALLQLPDNGKAAAQKSLDAVFDKHAASASAYQTARATSAAGSIQLASGKRDAAEERFRSAMAKAPTRGELYLPLAQYLGAQNASSEIDALLQKARDNDAYTVQLAFFEVAYHLKRSKPEAALKTLDWFEFDDPRITFFRGLSLLDQNNVRGALRAVSEAKHTRDTTNLEALRALVATLQPDGDITSEALTKLKSTHADNPFVHWAAAVTTIRSAQATSNSKDRTALLSAARSDLDRALALESDWARAYVTRCELQTLQLNTTQAEQACDTARKLAPDFVPALVATARLFLLRGEYVEAKKLSDRALELRPDDSVVGHLAARVAIETGELAEAQRQLDRFLGKEVDPYEQALLEGRLHFARENYTRAAGYLKEAQELRPTDGEASIYYGHTLARLGDYGNAGTLLRGYLDHPTWGGYAWAVLGEVRRKQQRLKDAYENLDAALRKYDGQDVPARFYSHAYTEYALANQIKYRKWDHPAVKSMLDKGAELGDAKDPGLNMAFGLYYLNLRKPNFAQAMNYIERVVDVAPYRCDAVDALLSLYSRADKPKSEVDALADVQKKNCPTGS